MARQRYESLSNLQDEIRFQRYLKSMGWKSRKLNEKKFRVDFAVWKQGPVAFFEYKRRYCKKSKYPTIMISLIKWKMLRELTNLTGGRFYVEFDDGLYYCAGNAPFTALISGRDDREDDEDIEVCAHIKIDHFKPAENWFENGPF